MEKITKEGNCPKNFKCDFDECTASFDRQWKLDGHISRHKNERPFKCIYQTCSKSYSTNSHLNRHIKSHSKSLTSSKKVICTFPNCFKELSNKFTLEKHRLTHTKTLTCTYCKAWFKTKLQLKTHVYQHTGLYPYHCLYCKEGFRQRTLLLRHARIHKTYNCEYSNCKVTTDSHNDLRRHYKIHHPIAYVCNFCQKIFTNKNQLQDHVLTHVLKSKKDVWQCHFTNCCRFYFHKRNLLHHINSFHFGRGFSCQCGRSFRKKSTLEEHVSIICPVKTTPQSKEI